MHSENWPRPRPRRFVLGLGLKVLSSFNITDFYSLVTAQLNSGPRGTYIALYYLAFGDNVSVLCIADWNEAVDLVARRAIYQSVVHSRLETHLEDIEKNVSGCFSF